MNERALPVTNGPLAYEALWDAALALTDHGSLYAEPIPFAEIDEILSEFPKKPIKFEIAGRGVYDLEIIRSQIEHLRESGKRELAPLWPGPDREVRGGWVWEPYSDKRIWDRATALFEGALTGYQQLVEQWFPRLAHGLQIYAMLPARLTGILTPPDLEMGIAGSPSVSWHLEILPRDHQTSVNIELSDDNTTNTFEHNEIIFEKMREQLHRLRPEAVGWIGAFVRIDGVDVSSRTPATNMAYNWLWDDLAQVGWVEGLFTPAH